MSKSVGLKNPRSNSLKNITNSAINSLKSPHNQPETFKNIPFEGIPNVQNQNDQNCIQSISSVCQIKESFLDGKYVKPVHRMQIKFWFMSEMKSIQLSRETYSISSRFLDLYLAKGQRVLLKSFQNLGISCFMLASKANQRMCPDFSFEQYGLQQILNFEKSLLQLLDYDIFPVTYFHLAEVVMSYWDKFSSQNQFKITYFKKDKQSLNRYRKIMDILDAADLVPEIYRFRIQDVVLCCFYVQNLQYWLTYNDKQKQGKQFLYTDSRQMQYEYMFRNFLEQLKIHQYFQNYKIQKQIIDFLKEFTKIDFVETGKYLRKSIIFQQLGTCEHRYLMMTQNVNPHHEKAIKQMLKKL